MNWRTGRGRRAEGLAEGLLLGDEGTLTECNATSQFDPSLTLLQRVRHAADAAILEKWTLAMYVSAARQMELG